MKKTALAVSCPPYPVLPFLLPRGLGTCPSLSLPAASEEASLALGPGQACGCHVTSEIQN